MIIIGVDYHPSFQQIAFVDKETGECNEQQLKAERQERGAFAVGQKAEVTDAHKALRKDVQ